MGASVGVSEMTSRGLCEVAQLVVKLRALGQFKVGMFYSSPSTFIMYKSRTNVIDIS